MKRLICLMLCLMLTVSVAFAGVPELFNAQLITGGFGLRGVATITASGTAPWLDMVLPFTATELKIRAIGQPQGAMVGMVDDADNWQIRVYAENAEGSEVGSTYLYNGDGGVYLQSEMLPGQLLMVPTGDMHMMYDLFRGDWGRLFFGFDPADLTGWTDTGRPAVYETIADMLGIDGETWDAVWSPVMHKYESELDLRMAEFGATTSSVDENGTLTISVAYTIPASDIKALAKHFIGQMLFDGELQNLLAEVVTPEVRSMYLNQGLIHFYEACIDALELQGDVVLSRAMSARGEVTSTTIALPLPVLPDELTNVAGQALSAVFNLPYANAFDGVNRVTLTQNGDLGSIELSGTNRTIRLAVNESADTAEIRDLAGVLQIMPAVGVNELPLFAAFTCRTTHAVYQDTKYLDHEESSVSLALAPDAELMSAGNALDFAPIAVKLSLDYQTDGNKENAPVQLNVNAGLQLQDADLSISMKLRTQNKFDMATLPVTGAKDVTALTNAELEGIQQAFIAGAVRTMININAPASPEPTATLVPPVEE